MVGPPERRQFPRAARVRTGPHIRTLLREGRRLRGRRVELFALPSPTGRPRFGTVVPKHRHRIVDRNLVRRRLREIGRTEVLPLLEARGLALDILVRAGPAAYSADHSDLLAELNRLMESLCSENLPSE